MAGSSNEFLITDIVSDKAFQELDRLNKGLASARVEFSATVEALGRKINVSPGSYEELTRKAKDYSEMLGRLNKSQQEMTRIQGQQLSVLRQVSKQMEGLSSLGKLAAMFDGVTKNADAASAALGKVAQSGVQSGAAVAEASAALKEQAKSYDELADGIANVMGTSQQNIRRLIEEQSAIRSITTRKSRI